MLDPFTHDLLAKLTMSVDANSTLLKLWDTAGFKTAWWDCIRIQLRSTKAVEKTLCIQEVARLAENDSGMDSPRADSELDLGVSDFSTPELLQVRSCLLLSWPLSHAALAQQHHLCAHACILMATSA